MNAPPTHHDLDSMYAVSYRELRRLAHARLRSGGRNTVLDTTALVHESWLRLAQAGGAVAFQDKLRFLSYAGHVMRSVIVDLVRERQTERRGGAAVQVTLSTQLGDAGGNDGEREILRVHEALEALAQLDPRMASVVELRYFGGLTEPEIAQALEIAERTVRRDWQQARLFLCEALR